MLHALYNSAQNCASEFNPPQESGEEPFFARLFNAPRADLNGSFISAVHTRSATRRSFSIA
jgi:hypothetical protein